MMKNRISGQLLTLCTSILFLLFGTACCSPSKEKEPLSPPQPAGVDETRRNVITLVTDKPVGSTIALSFKLDEQCNMPLLIEGLKDGFIQRKKNRVYTVYTITNPTIKLIGPIVSLNCGTPTDENIQPLEEHNRIKSIVVSPTDFLEALHDSNDAFGQEKLGCLEYVDVSKAPYLKGLYVRGNKLKSLDVTHNRELKYLYCSENELNSLDLSRNRALETLSISSNKLEYIDLSALRNLTLLNCSFCRLKTLDLNANSKLEYLFAQGNAITALDVTNNRKLIVLSMEENNLADLRLKDNDQLETLYLQNNKLTVLNLAYLPRLEEFYCYDNALKRLDFSYMPRVKTIACFDNEIRGEAMTQMLESLPTQSRLSRIALINPLSAKERNVCKKSDVAIAKERNWLCFQVVKPFDWFFRFPVEGAPYEGED